MIIGVREKVVKATIYPLFLLGFGLLVTFALLFFVLPSFAEVYQESRVELPWATQLLLDITHSANQWLLGILIVLAGAGSWLYWWQSTPEGQWRMHWFLLNAPILGPLFLKKSGHSFNPNAFNHFGWWNSLIIRPTGHSPVYAE